MDLTTSTTAPSVTQSDTSLPPPRNPSDYDHPQPQQIPLQLSAGPSPTDLTTSTTAPSVTQSDTSLPPPQNPSYYDHPQPQSQPQQIPLQLSARPSPMDLTTSTTAPSVTQSDTFLPPPQNPYYYDHPQPQSQQIPLQLPYPNLNPNPNPNHLHLASEPYAYYPQQAQQHLLQPQPQYQPQPQSQYQPQPQPQYYHYQQPTDAIPASYYQDPNWQYTYSQITTQVAHQLQNLPGVSNWVQQFVAATSNATAPYPIQAIPSQVKGSKKKKKKVSKKTEVVQSASCDICKVVCTSQEVLEQHKLGKKHMKNESKIAKLNTSAAVTSNPMIGPHENPANTKTVSVKKLKRTASTQGDLETKRMKIVQEGASATSVRVCAACNVVCNSETVFNAHIAGQKHAASMKKYLALAAV